MGRSTFACWIAALSVGAAGCRRGDEPADPVRDDPDPASTSSSVKDDPIDDGLLFDPTHLVRVDIDLAEADWDALRSQTRDLFEVLGGPGCLAQPFESPFDDFRATVTVDGETLSNVAVSKKGFLGSLSADKPSLRIETDEFVSGQKLANGTERIVLNNALQDPSLVRTCLSYAVFADAGVPAPRCNFALVTVNGAEMGVYVHVEAVKKDFLRRHFGADDGDLYEGTLSDFTAGWTATFDPDTDATDPTLAPIHALTDALELPDAEVLDAVGALVDLDAFYTFWAVESLVAHWDGYAGNTNNYFVYFDPSTGRMAFVPWGADGPLADTTAPVAFTTGWLARRLWAIPEAREAYLDALRAVLDTAWDEGALAAEIDRMAALVGPHDSDLAGGEAARDGVRGFVEARRAVVEEGIALADDLVVDLTHPDPEAWCIDDGGTVDATFETHWDSLDEDPFAGPPAVLVGDLLEPVVLSGSMAGYDPYYGVPELIVFGVSEDWSDLYELVVYLPAELEPGPIPVDLATASAYLVRVDLTVPDDEGEILGLVVGELVLDSVGTASGSPVVGSLSGQVLEGLF